MAPLFREESTEQITAGSDVDGPPPAKKVKRFFDDEDDDTEEQATSSAVKLDDPPEPKTSSSAAAARQPKATSELLLSDSDDDFSTTSNQKQPKGKAKASNWEEHYFGDIVVQAYALYSKGAFCDLKLHEKVSIHRIKPAPVPENKKSSKGKENTIVRFKNSKGVEVGRIAEKDAIWISKLLDLEMISFTGNCVMCDPNFRSGSNMTLSLTPYISRKAFTEPSTSRINPISRTSEGLKTFHDDLKETDEEKLLRERKISLNRLFEKTGLQPIVDASAKLGTLPASQSKRALLETFDAATTKKKNKGKEETGSENEEEGQVNEMQLNLVYKKAIKNDANLPEMDPAESFSLELRPYQKQALRWMYSMEVGDSNARENTSMHPLWEEYHFPSLPDQIEATESFYYNPYSGELSLQFPKLINSCRGGILADEMGLGKTLELAALIHTAKPREPVIGGDDVIETEAMELSDSSEDGVVPNRNFIQKIRPTQARLQGTDGQLGQVAKKGGASGRGTRPTATLVVAPMTLLAQWVSELERSSRGELDIVQYYGTGRKSLQEEIAAGCAVVVTSYGVLVSDYKRSGFEAELKKAKEEAKRAKDENSATGKPKRAETKSAVKRVGLFAIDWFRVVLDEAHNCKRRDTQNARAASTLTADRRWCLTGTPIVNRLEDLYSLLHFLRLEPWGNYSFFKTFVTVPFDNKDPKAIEVIQTVLESILLRREKKMKDKNGKPIVSVPEKHIQVQLLQFSPQEREIYDALYKNAKSKFLEYEGQGAVLQNVTAIFSILMRLRQAVLHPQLVLNRLAQNLKESKARGGRNAQQKQNDVDEQAIKNLIEGFSGNVSAAGTDSNVFKDLVEIDSKTGAEANFHECSICLDLAEDPIFLPECLHCACRQCILNWFAESEEKGDEARCPVCRSGPLTEKQISRLERGTPDTKFENSSTTQEILTLSDSSDESSADERPIKPGKRAAAKGKLAEKLGSVLADSSDQDNILTDSDADEELKVNGKQSSPTTGASTVSNLFQNDFKSSTKLDALVKNLHAAKEKDPKLKALVFSQFTGFLDLVERVMTREKFDYLRLDGAMTQQARQKVVQKFTTSPKSVIFLASLKAGGVGLNLIAADHVYMMDLWWNAAIENQAIDRVHRFGQTRPVYVTKFLVDQSIDDKMIALQERKTRVINGALGNSDKNKSGKALAEDLALIFAD